MRDLIAGVRRELANLEWPGQVTDEEIAGVARQFEGNSAAGTGTAARAGYIAGFIANGYRPLGLRGGALGFEVETGYVLGYEPFDDSSEELSIPWLYVHPNGLKVVVDYRPSHSGRESFPVPIAEIVSPPVLTLADEVRWVPGVRDGWPDQRVAFGQIGDVLGALAEMADGPRRGWHSLADALRAHVPGGWATDEAEQITEVVRRPAGTDWFVQYTAGVPLAGLYQFLRDTVLPNSSAAPHPNISPEVRLADGLAFGAALASDFAQAGARDADVSALRGFAALVFTRPRPPEWCMRNHLAICF